MCIRDRRNPSCFPCEACRKPSLQFAGLKSSTLPYIHLFGSDNPGQLFEPRDVYKRQALVMADFHTRAYGRLYPVLVVGYDKRGRQLVGFPVLDADGGEAVSYTHLHIRHGTGGCQT